MDKNVKLEEQGFDYHDEIDSDASYEEEFIYETDSEAEQPANGPRIKKMRIKRHLKDQVFQTGMPAQKILSITMKMIKRKEDDVCDLGLYPAFDSTFVCTHHF